ncbi:MAG: CopG family transcriptional regulator [Candidatus Heimdallarchaeota archaeon]|nr:CopG family transcriptional regulator [Candidatus Heimdallarchaeota archaeon]MCK4609798.1 CopG family transcriptional regulator [Candidatus Heimdallarchaeota archaeon]
MSKQEYVTFRIPKSLIDSVEELIKESELGYRNRSEFVIESVRLRLRELKTQKEEAVASV